MRFGKDPLARLLVGRLPRHQAVEGGLGVELERPQLARRSCRGSTGPPGGARRPGSAMRQGGGEAPGRVDRDHRDPVARLGQRQRRARPRRSSCPPRRPPQRHHPAPPTGLEHGRRLSAGRPWRRRQARQVRPGRTGGGHEPGSSSTGSPSPRRPARGYPASACCLALRWARAARRRRDAPGPPPRRPRPRPRGPASRRRRSALRGHAVEHGRRPRAARARAASAALSTASETASSSGRATRAMPVAAGVASPPPGCARPVPHGPARGHLLTLPAVSSRATPWPVAGQSTTRASHTGSSRAGPSVAPGWSSGVASVQIFPTVTSSARPGAAAAKAWNARLRASSSTSGAHAELARPGTPRWPARRRSRSRKAGRQPGLPLVHDAGSRRRAPRGGSARPPRPRACACRSGRPGEAEGRRRRCSCPPRPCRARSESPLAERRPHRGRRRGARRPDAPRPVAGTPARTQPRATARRGHSGHTTSRRRPRSGSRKRARAPRAAPPAADGAVARALPAPTPHRRPPAGRAPRGGDR